MPVSACQGAAVPEAALERSAAGLDQMQLSVRADGRDHRFTVEIARTLEEQNYGLMNRSTLAPDRGMIFPYDPPQAVAFWMKNTLIPLDIIFIGPGGKILNIAANATPLSLEPLPSAGPVEAVLEIPGGRAAQLGIAAGDHVQWRH